MLSYPNHAQVNTGGFPPLEDREASLSLLMGLDFFGGGVLPTEERVSAITAFCMENISRILNNQETSLMMIFVAITIKQLRLSSLEKKAVNDMFVILSDVWLDNPEVFLLNISSWFCVSIIMLSYSQNVIHMSYLVEKTMEKLAVVLDGYDC
jgi:hypothetical protein